MRWVRFWGRERIAVRSNEDIEKWCRKRITHWVGIVVIFREDYKDE
jgi:hypothetical protein